MLKALALFGLLSVCFLQSSWAQTPTTSVPPRNEQYCAVVVKLRSLSMSSGADVELDFGYGVGLPAALVAPMKEEADYVRKLTSPIDALNYLGTRGWEYLNLTSHGPNGIIHRYLLCRIVK